MEQVTQRTGYLLSICSYAALSPGCPCSLIANVFTSEIHGIYQHFIYAQVHEGALYVILVKRPMLQ